MPPRLRQRRREVRHTRSVLIVVASLVPILTAVSQASACTTLVGAKFEAGATYLVFLDPLGHYRAFERIDRADDRWLGLVKALIRKESGFR